MRTLGRIALVALAVLTIAPAGVYGALPDAQTAETPAAPWLATRDSRLTRATHPSRAPHKRRSAPSHLSTPPHRAPKRPDLTLDTDARVTASDRETARP